MELLSEIQISSHSQYYMDADNMDARIVNSKDSLKVLATKEVLI